MLVNEGCRALAYRLTGKEPLPRLCVQHLRANDRVVVAVAGREGARQRAGRAAQLAGQPGQFHPVDGQPPGVGPDQGDPALVGPPPDRVVADA